MSSSEDKLIVAFREEMRAGFGEFATEMREGLSQVWGRLDRTNELLLETRNETRTWMSETEAWMNKTEVWMGKTDSWMSKTDTLLNETRNEIKETRNEISSKLNGISNFLIQSEESHNKTNKRLDALETRVENLEKQKKRQS